MVFSFLYGIWYSVQQNPMTTKHNWITSNIRDRLVDPACDFKLFVRPETPRYVNFDAAVKEVVYEITSIGKPIFVGYSGGMDSEYVIRAFMRYGIPFKPITIETTGNQEELSYAKEFYKHNDIEPIIIKVPEIDMVKQYYHTIVKKLNGRGQNSTANVIAGAYVKDRGGVFVMAEHLIDDGRIAANEWDYYNDGLFGEGNTVHFFNYTPEICCSIIRKLNFRKPIQEAKSELYNLTLRPKFNYEGYSEKYFEYMRAVLQLRKYRPDSHFDLGPADKFLNRFNINI